jgi:site-specific DNA recombinase
MVYFLYVRKSTDLEDRQVRSIEDQLAVLRALAKEQGFHVVREFTEKETAKKPGRPIFNDMMKLIESGEAQGVLCWKLDRLSRNPVDGGQISWLLQQNIIQHIRTYEKDYRPIDNVVMMAVELGMATQYVIDLAQNTKRGLHEKAKRGEYPSVAPLGYLNDVARKVIVKDRREAPVVIKTFELCAEGNSRLEDLSLFLFKGGIKTRATNRWRSEGGRPLSRDQVSAMLSNPFYMGFFRYAGELYEGKHPALVSKKLFDKVQEILKERGRPRHEPENDPKPLCGLLRCGECGRSITAEEKIKRQKNGDVHTYVYYRCTKKNTICSQPFIREEALVAELSDVMGQYALPHDWAAELRAMADKDEREAVQSTATASQATREEITAIEKKFRLLLEARLEEDIDRDTYREQKAELLSRKKSLEEKIAGLSKGHVAWLEPLRDWIKDAENLGETALTPTLSLKKSLARKFFGSNLSLLGRKILITPTTLSDALRASRLNFSQKTLCTSLVPSVGIEPTSRP